MATILVQESPRGAEQQWGYHDFPHVVWPLALVEVNDEAVIPELVEYGKASTGQLCLVITFQDGSKLDVWLDPDPHSHLRDYAVWKSSPFHDLNLSTCPEWRMHRCPRCQVKVLLWAPPDQVVVDIRFCERDDHKRLIATPHARIAIRNRGCTQKRLLLEEPKQNVT
jgi:hypothetical protein